ncbi:Tn3 family transposase [Deinococcus marmoris]|uniref:Tn3 family transposase n=1 Tax=Deinococcus marmoris TaxID=249408 RepID=UPI0034C5EFC4
MAAAAGRDHRSALPTDDGVDGRTAAAQNSDPPNPGVGTAGDCRARSGRSERQHNRASSINLLVAVITTWNTVYLGQAVSALRAEGIDIPDELLAHVSPLGWEHVGLTGDYLWRPEDVPPLGTFRKLNG